MTEQSMEGVTTPQDVTPTPAVQPAVATPPQSQDNVDVYRKLQSERDSAAAEAERLRREKAEAEALLNQKLTADEQHQRLIEMRNRALEEQLQQTQAEAERIKSEQIKQRLLNDPEFADLKTIDKAVLDNIQGDEDTVRTNLAFLKNQMENYYKAKTSSSKNLESAEPQSPAVENVANTNLTPEEFSKLPKDQKKSLIDRMFGGKSLSDMEF